MKKLLTVFFMLPLFCMAQGAPADTISLNEGNFHTAWSHKAKYPVKVYWRLTRGMIDCLHPLKRCNCFQADKQLLKETNLNADYAGSGFDQGHNFNAKDDQCAPAKINLCCWYFTNMSAQLPNLNRITWRALENQCRAWVRAGDELLIECGSFGKLKTFGKNKVWVPTFCWKVVRHKNGATDSYLMPNSNDVNKHSFAFYHTDITVIRQKTGIDNI
jgi:endonuclease G, mitochondrial